MMILTTWPERSDAAGMISVHWKTGTHNGGVIRVIHQTTVEDPLLVAELCAIRHLLLRKQVFNRLPMSGKGLALHVSTGAIRKLMLGTSNKREAVPYARFLRPRFDEITIKPQRLSSEDFPLSAIPENCEELSTKDPYFVGPYDPIEGPAIGKLTVSAHAVEQYEKRCPSETIHSPWKSLVKRLMHEELEQIELPENVIRHKERKYGKDNKVEAWGHPNSLFGYLVVQDGDQQRTLVTVYRRSTGR